MNQRFLMWGLASIAFTVTLGVSAWQQGLWPLAANASSDARPPGAAAIATAPVKLSEAAQLPLRPFAPDKATPAVTSAVTPEPQAQQQEQPSATPAEIPAPDMPTATAEVYTAEFLAHRDRAAQHSSRAR